MSVASMPAFLDAVGHAEDLVHFVERHPFPSKTERFVVFGGRNLYGNMEQKGCPARGTGGAEGRGGEGGDDKDLKYGGCRLRYPVQERQ